MVRQPNRILSSTGCLLVVVLASLSAAEGDWPQWRGPDRNGVGRGGPALASAWPATLKRLWVSEAISYGKAHGYSTPSIADGRVYLFVAGTAVKEGRGDVIYCLDATNGKTLWRSAHPAAKAKTYGSSGTVCVDHGKVYVAGTGSKMYCLAAEDGSRVWTVDLGAHWSRSEANHSSFLVVDGMAIIQGGQHDGPDAAKGGVVALDAADGDLLWSRPKHGSEGSPVIWRHEGKTSVLTVAADGIFCHELKTGRLVWTATPGGSSHTLAVSGDRAVLLSDAYPDRGLVCFRMTGSRAEVAWMVPGRYDAGSGVVIHDGHVYAAASNRGEHGRGRRGTALCANLETGAVAWDVEMPNYSYVCPLIVDDKFFIAHPPHVIMVDASPDRFTELGRADVGIAPYISPVVAGGKLFVRGPKGVACYALPLRGDRAVATRPAATTATPATPATPATRRDISPRTDPLKIVVGFVRPFVPEGGTATFLVRLSGPPAGDVEVTVARTGGDADIAVAGGERLRFTKANWSSGQTVTLSAAKDEDDAGGIAELSLSAPGMETVTLDAYEVDAAARRAEDKDS